MLETIYIYRQTLNLIVQPEQTIEHHSPRVVRLHTLEPETIRLKVSTVRVIYSGGRMYWTL